MNGEIMETERYHWCVWMYGTDQDAFDRWDGSDRDSPGRRWFDAYDIFEAMMRRHGTTWYAEA